MVHRTFSVHHHHIIEENDICEEVVNLEPCGCEGDSIPCPGPGPDDFNIELIKFQILDSIWRMERLEHYGIRERSRKWRDNAKKLVNEMLERLKVKNVPKNVIRRYEILAQLLNKHIYL